MTQPSARQPDPGDTSPLANTPSNAAGIPGAPSALQADNPKLGSTGPAVPTADEVLQEVAKSGTNIDTLVGRLVIDQGFVTPEELSHALAQAKNFAEENNQRSLADLLVENEYITRRQMLRLREVANAERSGQKIPGFKILAKLGAGAMATVFKAKQLSLDRMVAIKVLPRKFSSNP